MKRNKLVSIAAITVALGVLATGCAGGSGSSKSDSKSFGGTKTVTVKAGTGANVKPYTYVGDDNETTGYDVEVLKEEGTLFGDIKLIKTPAKHYSDASISLLYSPELQAELIRSESITSHTMKKERNLICTLIHMTK